MQIDSSCAMQMIKQGAGSFNWAKHKPISFQGGVLEYEDTYQSYYVGVLASATRNKLRERERDVPSSFFHRNW